MYFYKKQGRQYLDLRGDLVLTINPDLVRARIRSAAPFKVKHAEYVRLHGLKFRKRLRLVLTVARFILFPPKPLSRERFEEEGL